MGCNVVLLCGTVSKQPVLTPVAQTQKAQFTLITTEPKKGGGEFKVYHNVRAWGERAVSVSNFVKIGNIVFVKGKLKVDSWEDKETKKRVYMTFVDIDDFEVLQGGGTVPAQAESEW